MCPVGFSLIAQKTPQLLVNIDFNHNLANFEDNLIQSNIVAQENSLRGGA
jgi:hypothetical protein